MNWGGFAGGLSTGFMGGVQMGKTLKTLKNERAIEGVRAQGTAEAKAAREAAINEAIQEGAPSQAATAGITGSPVDTAAPQVAKTEAAVVPAAVSEAPASEPSSMPSAAPSASAAGEGAKAIASSEQPTITPQVVEKPAAANGLPFTVGGKGYATREAARKAAEKNAPGVMEFMSKTMVPRMQQAYLEQGNVEMADAWGKWAEEKDNKAAMKEWASAYRAATSGNFEKAADHVFNLYKRYDDGITPMSKETVKDKDGNITGFNVRLKNDKSGEEYSQFIDKKALTEMGLAALAPPQMFEMQFKRQQQADTAAAEAAKDERNFSQQKELKGIEHGNALEKMSIEKQLDAANATNKVKLEVKAKVDALKGAGYSEEFINGVLPGIIGVGEYKRATAPEEARRLAHSDRMKSDPMYSRKSADEQKVILDKDMAIIYAGGKPSETPRAASGLPPVQGQQKGVPFYDTKTGKVVYR